MKSTSIERWRGTAREMPRITKHGYVGYLCKCGCGRTSQAPIDCRKYPAKKDEEGTDAVR